MRKRRNVCRFRVDPVPDEDVLRVIEAARWAPSGANAQPWEFVVVRDQETKDAIAEVFIEETRGWRKADTKFPFRPEDMLRRKYTGAPLLIAVCADPRCMEAYPIPSPRLEIQYVGLGAAIQNLQLAAAALGLATGWGTVYKSAKGRIKEILDIPFEFDVAEVIPMGYSDQAELMPYRRETGSVTHWDKFDHGRTRTDAEFRELLDSRPWADMYFSLGKQQRAGKKL